MDTTGAVVVERVGGKSTVTRCFSKYPLKLIVPTKVVSSRIDAVWVVSLSYGGGIVSGDRVSCDISVGDGCVAAFTTQASTKVYKSVDLKCSEQILEAKIGKNALLAVIPDPVTCFAAARYAQRQNFVVVPGSSLVVVDWFTSGRLENGERWKFDYYRSTNNIFLNEEKPLFLDSVLLEQGGTTSIAESMHSYQVIAMIILLGPKLENLQRKVQDQVKKMMAAHYLHPPRSTSGRNTQSSYETQRSTLVPSMIASCSVFGPKGEGLVVRVAALTTESVYDFLREQLADLEPLLGVPPYSR